MAEASSGGFANVNETMSVDIDVCGEHYDQTTCDGSIVSVQSTEQASSESINRRTPSGSFLDRFLSGFFDEKNIKWLLVIGAGIIFGSSLMLVTREWSHWSVAFKYFTVLGYTAAGFCAAEISRKRLALRTTSRVLHALTLMLLPILFLSLSWMSVGTATQAGMGLIQLLTLMAPATAMAWFASRRIFVTTQRRESGLAVGGSG